MDISIIDTLYFLVTNVLLPGSTTGRRRAGQPGAKSYRLVTSRGWFLQLQPVAGHRHFFFSSKGEPEFAKKSQVTELRDTQG